MPTFDLDVQSACLAGPDADPVLLSGQEMALHYWARLGAPDARIARALRLEASGLASLYQNLAQRLGLDASSPKDALASLDVRMKGGVWPRSETDWSARHAVTLLHNGFFADTLTDRPFATVAGEGTLSLFEVAGLIAQVRNGLAGEGIGPGSFVALDATQCFEIMIISCAALLQGAAIVRLADNAPISMLRDNLQAAPAQITFTTQTKGLADVPQAGQLIDLGEGDAGFQSFGDWLDQFPETALPYPNVSPSDVAFVGFTSGTTGKPKTILNTHESLWRSSEVAMQFNSLGPDDVFCSATDIVSMGSFRNMVPLPLLSGGQVLFLSPEARKSPLAQALECQTHKVTFLTAIPNVIRGFIQTAARFGALPDLHTVIIESGILDGASKAEFHRLFQISVSDIYGKRETNHLLRSDPDVVTPIAESGGQAMQALIRILDPSGAPVDVGETGELYIMTDCMALDTEEVTIGATQGDHMGWHPSGDLGRVTPDGKVTVSGRLSEIIKTPDGQLLAPLEVETALMTNAHVLEACVFSVVSTDGIEKIGASVRVKAPLNDTDVEELQWELRRHVQDQLGRFKTPENILVLDSFPRVARQKPDQRALRTAYQAAFDPSAQHG